MVKPITLTVDEVSDVLLLPSITEVLSPGIISEWAYAAEISYEEVEKILEKAYYETVRRIAKEVFSTLLDVEIKLVNQEFRLTPKKGRTWVDVASRLASISNYISEERLKKEYLFDTGKKRATYREVVEWALPFIKWLHQVGQINLVAAFPSFYAFGVSWAEVFDRFFDENVYREFYYKE